ERLARLVDFHRRDPASPGVTEVLDAIVDQVFRDRYTPRASGTGLKKPTTAAPAPPPRLAEILRSLEAVTVRRLLAAAPNPAQTPGGGAAPEAWLETLATGLENQPGPAAAEADLRALLARDIRRYFAAQATGPAPALAGAPELPPGPPIGAGTMDDDECGWE